MLVGWLAGWIRLGEGQLLTAFHDARDDGADKGDGEGVVDVEFEGCLGVVVAVMRQDVEEGPHQVEAFAGDVGYLEDGAYSLADELGLGCAYQLPKRLCECRRRITAVFIVSSWFLMKIGIFLAPGDLSILVNWVMVCCKICGGQMSIFVITTITGTFNARAMPRCSLYIWN